MDPEEKNRPMESSVMKLCHEFGENTTMHGVGRAATSKRPWRRVVWLVMVLCGVGWALYQLVDVTRDYYAYPVTSVVTLKHERRMMFPAITICNINSVKSSTMLKYFTAVLPSLIRDIDIDYQAFLNFQIRYIQDDGHNPAGHEMSDMLIRCLFKGKPCSADNFTEFKTGTYGLCHTFHGDDWSNMYVNSPGPQNGLVIEMSIEHMEYTSLASQGGVKVVIHKHDEVAFPEDGGILVQPGMSTSISVKKTVTRRLPPPYGNCVSQDGEAKMYKSMYDEEKFKYTENACWKTCHQLALYEACDCCDLTIPCDSKKIFRIFNKQSEDEPFVRFCNITHKDIECLVDLEWKFMNEEINCSESCPPACDQIKFDAVVSTALWPTDPYLDVLIYQANKTVLKNMTFDSQDDLRHFITKNFLRLEVFYETNDFLEVVTVPKYDWSDLFGDIGGNLGLWLGFSILTALELLELCLDMVVVVFRRLQGRFVAKRRDMDDCNV